MTSAKPSVMSAKYHVDSRKAGSAISRPTPAAIAIASSAAGQNDQCRSTIVSAAA